MNFELFTAFVLITIVLIITPGPVVTLIVSTGATYGVRAALTAVFGAVLGGAILVSAIALGLSWVLKNAAELFEILRWAGVAYLVWLGIQAWRHAGDKVDAPPLKRIHFSRGVVVALTNPKTIAFFTAFLPQFVDPSLPADRQLFVMCVTFMFIAWFIDSCWAVASGMGRAFFMKPGRVKLLGRLSGVVLIGGGIWLSLARRPL